MIQGRLVLLDRDYIVATGIDDLVKVRMLITYSVDRYDRPFKLEKLERPRDSLISLDFSVVFTCPTTTEFALAKAPTMWTKDRLLPRRIAPRSVFPSMATTPSIAAEVAAIQEANICSRASGFNLPNTRPSVSWLGTPLS